MYAGGLGLCRCHSQSWKAPFKITWTLWRGCFCIYEVESHQMASLHQKACEPLASNALWDPQVKVLSKNRQTRRRTSDHPPLSFCLKNNGEKHKRRCHANKREGAEPIYHEAQFNQKLTLRAAVFLGESPLWFFWEVPAQVCILPGWSEASEENGNCFFYFSSLPSISSLTTSAAATFYFFPLQLFQ